MKNKSAFREQLYFKQLYANKRRLSKTTLRHEAKVASAVGSVIESNGSEKFVSILATKLEWLLTWKLKFSAEQNLLWCDGLIGLNVKIINSRTIAFESELYLGYENIGGNPTKGYVSGEINVKPSHKKLKSYFIEALHEGNTYQAKKLNKSLQQQLIWHFVPTLDSL